VVFTRVVNTKFYFQAPQKAVLDFTKKWLLLHRDIQLFERNIAEQSRKMQTKRLHTTSGFTQAGVYSRRQFCGDLEVCRPPEPLWNPRLREAATTLAASEVLRCQPKATDSQYELKL